MADKDVEKKSNGAGKFLLGAAIGAVAGAIAGKIFSAKMREYKTDKIPEELDREDNDCDCDCDCKDCECNDHCDDDCDCPCHKPKKSVEVSLEIGDKEVFRKEWESEGAKKNEKDEEASTVEKPKKKEAEKKETEKKEAEE